MKMTAQAMRYILLALGLLVVSVSVAAESAPPCASIADAAARLQCYDAQDVARAAPARSYLTRSWDLDNRDDELLGDGQSPLRPYRTSYLIVRRSDNTNAFPASPTHAADALPLDIENTEMKFQISQKAKVLNALKFNTLGIAGMRLWAAYTQQSNWQAFNTGNSSPFRETNYAPELILTLRLF
jgi:phospholipase A1